MPSFACGLLLRSPAAVHSHLAVTLPQARAGNQREGSITAMGGMTDHTRPSVMKVMTPEKKQMLELPRHQTIDLLQLSDVSTTRKKMTWRS